MRLGINQLHSELNTNLENGYDREDRKHPIQNEVRWRKISNEASETKQTKAQEQLDPLCSSGVTTFAWNLICHHISWKSPVFTDNNGENELAILERKKNSGHSY